MATDVRFTVPELLYGLQSGIVNEQEFVDHLLCRPLTIGYFERDRNGANTGRRVIGDWDMLTDAFEKNLISKEVYMELKKNSKFRFLDPNIQRQVDHKFFDQLAARQVHHESFVDEIRWATHRARLSFRGNPDKVLTVITTAAVILVGIPTIILAIYGLTLL